MNVEPDEPLIPDLADRCQSALRREWLRVKVGPPWIIEKPFLQQLILEDELRMGLPPAWRKLLVLANVEANAIKQLPESIWISAEEFTELKRWTNSLGPRETFEEEDFEDEIPPVETSPPEEEISDQTLPQQITGRNTNYRNNYAFIICLAGLVIAAWWFERSRTPGDLALNEQLRTAQALLTRREAEIGDFKQREATGLATLKGLNDRMALQEGMLTRISEKNIALEKKVSLIPSLQAKLDQAQKTLSTERGPAVGLGFKKETQVAGGSKWETSSPSYTAVRKVRPVFTWDPSKLPIGTNEVCVQVIRADNGKTVWTSNPVAASPGSLTCGTLLARGQNYEWLLKATSRGPSLRWSRLPFYVLSAQQNTDLETALSRAGSSAQRAQILQRSSLFSELIGFGGPIATDAKEEIRKLATK